MNPLTKIVTRFGYIEVFTNENQSTVYAIPNGYVGPKLVKKDLKFLEEFDRGSKAK